ncbi:30S ribosome-binding factor RbfA [Phenylobacterium sp.]|uniref:30S ribosome-binding factor RbfA n=1 Tax=Phenylobacterium sp. TaxID=1871053 RepID=UPI0039839110
MSRASPRHGKSRHAAPSGPSQRQLRAGELIRHALVESLREEHLADPALADVSVTVSEVRMSSDLKHAICFVEPLGAGVTGAATQDVVKALNSASKLLRGRLGRLIDMRFTPDLKFFHDDSFNHAARIDRLFDNPVVQKDLHPGDAPPAARDDDGEG